MNSNGVIGVNGDASQGGSQVNFFTNPAAVYNNFRPFILGIDGRTGGAGILRGQMRYNLDLGITKDTQDHGAIRLPDLRSGIQCPESHDVQRSEPEPAGSGEFRNAELGAGTGGQYNAQTLGGSLASANYTRIIQVGLRVYF